jgi:predicted dehydrogenase
MLKRYVEEGELGDIFYIYSHRLNLGVVRQQENALWSLAPHDISVILHLLDKEPIVVSAQGMDHLQAGIEDTVMVSLRFAGKQMAYCHVSWLDPHKVRRITVVGSHKMAVFDDVESMEKLRIYDRGVNNSPRYESYGDSLSVRFGDVYIPRVDMREPLRLECQHFLECVREGQRPLSDGEDGLRVLRVLDAAQRSLKLGGQPVPCQEGR